VSENPEIQEADVVSASLLPVKAEPQSPEVAQKAAAPMTAAQAKVDAVANLTFKAYERASMLALTPDETKALQADFPDGAFQPGAAGKEHLIYIEHAYLRDRLSQVFGVGQWALIPRNRWAEPFTTFKGTEGQRVYVEAMLVIRGCFVSEAVGAMEYYPKNEAQNYGDAAEGAKTAALRRCCKELGVGLQAWKKDWCEGWWTRRRAIRTPTRATPLTAAAAKPAAKPVAAPPVAPGSAKWAVELQKLAKERLVTLLSATPPTRAAALTWFIREGLILDTEDLQDAPAYKLFPLPEVGTAEEHKERVKDRQLAIMQGVGEIADAQQAGQPPVAVPEDIKVPRDPGVKSDEQWELELARWPVPSWSEHFKRGFRTFADLRKAQLNGGGEFWWWWAKWEPKSWRDKAGALHPPKQADLDLRKMLDMAREHYEPNAPQDPDDRADNDGNPANYGDA
jgi:hypothetical protein